MFRCNAFMHHQGDQCVGLVTRTTSAARQSLVLFDVFCCNLRSYPLSNHHFARSVSVLPRQLPLTFTPGEGATLWERLRSLASVVRLRWCPELQLSRFLAENRLHEEDYLCSLLGTLPDPPNDVVKSDAANGTPRGVVVRRSTSHRRRRHIRRRSRMPCKWHSQLPHLPLCCRETVRIEGASSGI